MIKEDDVIRLIRPMGIMRDIGERYKVLKVEENIVYLQYDLHLVGVSLDEVDTYFDKCILVKPRKICKRG